MNSRRRFIQCGLTGFAAYTLHHPSAFAFSSLLKGSARRCIILWMDGGPSQLETFDPKPDTGTGGPTKAIATDVPGLRFSENLPLLAQHASDLCVVRSLTSGEGEHDRARYLNHTGFVPVAAFPRPELGSLFAHRLHEGELPGFITLGGEGFGAAYLGDQYAPFAVGRPEATVRLLQELQGRRHRFQLLDRLSVEFDSGFPGGPVNERRSRLERVEGLLQTGLVELLNVERVSEVTRNRYGDSEFARRLLCARRLLEGGVTCVEVPLAGWDTHVDNFATVRQLCGTLDQPWSALIDDLKSGGLWDETLVIWLGDFGRTPTINGQEGRDHFPGISDVVLSGGGIPGGISIGETSRDGMEIIGQPVSTADLFATILHRIGVSPDAAYETSFGSPTAVTDKGQVIADLR